MSNLRWTNEHDFELLKLLGRGETCANIAKKLGFSVRTVRHHAKRLDAQPSKNTYIYPLNSIPTRFIRVPIEHVREWVRRGWLPKPTRIKTQTKGRYLYRYTREQLEAFLEVEEAWVSWQPEDLIERDLQIWAAERRAAAGWRWILATEAAVQLGYTPTAKTIRSWADPSQCLKWATRLWVRSTEVERIRHARQANPYHRGTLSYRYGEPTELRHVNLSQSQISFLETAYGDVAEGLRRLVEQAMSRQVAAD